MKPIWSDEKNLESVARKLVEQNGFDEALRLAMKWRDDNSVGTFTYSQHNALVRKLNEFATVGKHEFRFAGRIYNVEKDLVSATWDTSATKATHPQDCECVTCQRYNMAIMRIEALRDVRALWRSFFDIACRSHLK